MESQTFMGSCLIQRLPGIQSSLPELLKTYYYKHSPSNPENLSTKTEEGKKNSLMNKWALNQNVTYITDSLLKKLQIQKEISSFSCNQANTIHFIHVLKRNNS